MTSMHVTISLQGVSFASASNARHTATDVVAITTTSIDHFCMFVEVWQLDFHAAGVMFISQVQLTNAGDFYPGTR